MDILSTIKYILIAQQVYENKHLIYAVSALSFKIVKSCVVLPVIDYVSRCKCSACEYKRKTGKNPDH